MPYCIIWARAPGVQNAAGMLAIKPYRPREQLPITTRLAMLFPQPSTHALHSWHTVRCRLTSPEYVLLTRWRAFTWFLYLVSISRIGHSPQIV